MFTGFRYGSDIVPFSKVDQEQMKYKHDGKCFAVLGFTKRNLVLYFFMVVVCTWCLSIQVKTNVRLYEPLNFILFTVCLKIRRHQFMGSQVVKMFAPKDDEVRTERTGMSLWITCWYWPVSATTVPSEQHAGVALSALIRALDELEMVAIVRYAYDRRSNPQVGAAFPCVKPHYEVRSQTLKHAVDKCIQWICIKSNTELMRCLSPQ